MIEVENIEDQNGLRLDGRRALELRQIRIKMGVFGQADGSGYIEHGNTKILVTVYGPHQVNNFSYIIILISLYIKLYIINIFI